MDLGPTGVTKEMVVAQRHLELGDHIYQNRFDLLQEEYRPRAERYRKQYVHGITTEMEFALAVCDLYCEQEEKRNG